MPEINPLFTPFTWACGIEDTFIPQRRPGLRALDEYELTQHYHLWKRDFDLVAESGVQAVRWGIPWYRVQPAPHRWDWNWTDAALEYLVKVKGITPILDLMHYGTPQWLDNSFINASYPARVAEYAAAVAERYASFIRYYTPLNEPMVNAEFCGRKAEWPPYLQGDDGDVKMILALARGLVETTRALLSVQPSAQTVQVEALWHNWSSDPALQAQVEFNNARQYVIFDLVTGRAGADYPLRSWLLQHGARAEDLEWFLNNPVNFDVLGANFYPWSYGEVIRRRDGSLKRVNRPTHGSAIATVIQSAWQRYHLPVMITETSAPGSLNARAKWMDETIQAAAGLRQAGIPVVGYTWFPLLTMIDWAYRQGRRPLSDYLLHLGLVDSAFDASGVLQRHPTELMERYRAYQKQPMPVLVESGKTPL